MPIRRIVRFELVESTQKATHYYYIPQHNILIPKCENAQTVLNTILEVQKDLKSFFLIAEYPIITHEQSLLFSSNILAVKVHYIKYIERELIRLNLPRKLHLKEAPKALFSSIQEMSFNL